MVSPEAAREVADQAEALGQTVSLTAAQILERHLNARTHFEHTSAAMAGVESQAKAAAAELKTRKRAFAADTTDETTKAFEGAKSVIELLNERTQILRESLAEAQAELDAATAEFNSIEIDRLKAEADGLWGRMSETVESAAAAVVATRSEYKAFEQLRAQLAANARQREALGALRDVHNEYRWDGMAWMRACQKAFSAANSGEFPMSEGDAQHVAFLLYNSTPYNQR